MTQVVVIQGKISSSNLQAQRKAAAAILPCMSTSALQATATLRLVPQTGNARSDSVPSHDLERGIT